MTSPATATATAGAEPQTTGSYDLRTFLSAVGTPSGGRALTTEPADRPTVPDPVELLEDTVVQVTAAPMQVAGWIDGVQNGLVVTHREHRPIYLAWAASGAVGRGSKLVGIRQKLVIMCSTLDRDWLEAQTTPDRRPPFEELSATEPPEVERQAVQLLGGIRDDLERTLVADLTEQGQGPLVVDGSLLGRPHDRDLHGVVKTTRRRYLADETILYNLPAGYRSPIFRIPAGMDGVPVDRYSTYVRLHDARSSAWDFALIRLESFRPDALDPLAARALGERQGRGSGDHRFDRHLAPVAATEKVLRSFRPVVFTF